MPSQGYLDILEAALGTVLSAVVLTPIAVICSGKWFSRCVRYREREEQCFSVPIPRVLKLRATREEVTLGFTAFVLTFVAFALPLGKAASERFTDQVGADLGQWQTIVMLTAFITLVWTFLLYVVLTKISIQRDRTSKEHNELINRLSRVDRGDSPWKRK